MISLMAYHSITTLLLTQQVVDPGGKSPSRISRQGACRLQRQHGEKIDTDLWFVSKRNTVCSGSQHTSVTVRRYRIDNGSGTLPTPPLKMRSNPAGRVCRITSEIPDGKNFPLSAICAGFFPPLPYTVNTPSQERKAPAGTSAGRCFPFLLHEFHIWAGIAREST